MPVATLVSVSASAIQFGERWFWSVAGSCWIVRMGHVYLNVNSFYAKDWFLLGQKVGRKLIPIDILLDPVVLLLKKIFP